MIIPKIIQEIVKVLEKAGFEAYLVGGCVRDLLRKIKPADWDITTNAQPEQIQKVFEKAGYKAIYENEFGTVAIITQSKQASLKTIEITPYRIEAKYSDKRHPDEIKWAKTIEDDLARRDFTVNAIALTGIKNEKLKIIDLFEGQKDLENKIIRAVGEPAQRFQEDALRLMRAVRFAVCLDKDIVWQIEEKTKKAIKANSHLLKCISQERIRDELLKIIMSSQAARAIELLRRLGPLEHIMPELLAGFRIKQSKHHFYSVYQHGLLSLYYAAQNNFSLPVRLAALLHDIAKPQTKKGEGDKATFYQHEIVGAKMTDKILRRLRFSNKDRGKIVKLVRFHLFYYNTDEVGPSSVRRLLRQVGQEDIEELLKVRYADRIGSAVPKAEPYKLRHLRYMLEKVKKDPLSVKMLKINGDEIMKILNIRPGPKIGHILSYLLSEALSEPKNNTKKHLTAKVKELGKMSEAELSVLSKKAEKYINEIKQKQDAMTKAKYWVS